MERITIAAITANPAHKMPSRLLKLPYSSKKTPIPQKTTHLPYSWQTAFSL